MLQMADKEIAGSKNKLISVEWLTVSSEVICCDGLNILKASSHNANL